MADILLPILSGQFKRLRDMGDGTFAEVMALGADTSINLAEVEVRTGGNAVGAENPLPTTDAATLAKAEAIRALLAGTIVAGGITPRVVASYTIPGDSNAFADGDILANSATAAAVVPITFDVGGASGELIGVRCEVIPASGAAVIANLAFDLLVFRSKPGVPFAAGAFPANNAALDWASIAAAGDAIEQLVGVFNFYPGAATSQGAQGWKAYGGGKVAYQRGTLMSGVHSAPFNIAEYGTTTLVGMLQARGAWSNGNVAHELRFAADIRRD